LLYVPYTLLLHRDSFFRLNRFVLLGVLLLSLVLPLCNVSWLSMDRQPVVHAAQMQMVEIGIPVNVLPQNDVADEMAEVSASSSFTLFGLLTLIYIIGMAVVLLLRLWQMGSLRLQLRRGSLWRHSEDGITVYCHADRVAPFSWMNSIVISEEDYAESGREIILHETGHIRFRHSWDVLLLTLVQMVQWWNPLAYMAGISLRDVHEYEADDYVLRQGVSASAYQMLLLKKAVGYGSYTFANNFNHSLTKKRITMMRKSKSNPWMRSKALYVIPVAALALSAFATPEIVSPIEGMVSEPESKGMENYLTGQAAMEENRQNAATMEILKAPVAGNRLPADATYYVDGEKMERGIAVRRIVDGREVVLITRKGENGKETVTVVGSSKNDAVDEAKALLRKEGVQKLDVKKEGANDNDSIYNVVSENAEFPGGNMAASNWISKNMTYPEECRKQGIEGRVVIKFVVNKDGSIVDAEAVKSPHPALAEEGLRVVKSMPKWKPAKEGGKVVRSRFNIPIVFKLSGKKPQSASAQPQKPQSPQSLTDEQKAVHDWFGAQPELMTHLNKNIRYPKECQEQGFEGRVLVSIAVEKDGSVSVDGSEYKPVSSKNDTPVAVNAYKNADGTQAAKLSEEELKNLMIKEAERVLKLSPKLKPYKDGKGETVRATFKVPVMFRLH
ncbi:MAG: TonB family protein, partial [Bacteroidaceae bacterium]|nr:TonB family protein [Bacteroidaceae bacterium]